MKKVFIQALCLLLAVALSGCAAAEAPAVSETPAPTALSIPEPAPSHTPEPEPASTPAPGTSRQIAESVLGKQEFKSAEDLLLLLEAVEEKKADAIAAVSAVTMEDEALLGALIEEINYEFDGLKAEAEAFDGDDSSLMCERLLGFWSELEDISDRAAGYAGLCYAMCRGTDIFSFNDDAKIQRDLESFPEDYFFSGFTPSFEAPCYFAYCDEYLEGYGMEEPQMALVCADEWTSGQTDLYVQAMRESGLYTVSESETDGGGYMCSGCWVGSGGEKCYVTAIYSTDTAAFISDIGVEPSFLVLSGNFDFMFCMNAAFTYSLNAAFS